LRILRFFRFTAEYAEGDPDHAGLKAAVELRDGLEGLSGERIRAELLRLLAAPRAVEIVAVMQATGLLERVLGGRIEPDLLARVAAIERALARNADPLMRLAALAGPDPGRALALRDRLKLSNSEYERLARMALPDTAFDPATAEREARIYLYRHGAAAFFDGAVIAWARSVAAADDGDRRTRLTLPARWRPPELPVRGSDVVALGVTEGPAVGRVVRAFEDWWLGEDFPSDPAVLAAALARFAAAAKRR
jgi:poly(A) polymerase